MWEFIDLNCGVDQVKTCFTGSIKGIIDLSMIGGTIREYTLREYTLHLILAIQNTAPDQVIILECLRDFFALLQSLFD